MMEIIYAAIIGAVLAFVVARQQIHARQLRRQENAITFLAGFILDRRRKLSPVEAATLDRIAQFDLRRKGHDDIAR